MVATGEEEEELLAAGVGLLFVPEGRKAQRAPNG